VIGAGIFALKSGRGAARPIHSIAVLPLQSLSPDAGQDYFADGITEELITNLAQRLKLRVISRTSVMPYKGTNKPIGQIARELGVEAIVEGSVARVGDRVTLTVQLIDATEDRHLWAGKYERRIEDILAVEAELSQAVAAQVSGTLNVAQSRLAASRVPAPRVYDLCLLGRYHWGKRTREGLIKAEEYFREAIELDPSYAPAYAGLANTYAMRPHYDAVSMADYSAKATATARQALALDDTLAEAHTTLGFIALGGADSAGAESEFRRALELNPSYAFAHHWFAYFLLFADRPDEALAEVELARQLDPLSAVINADQGEFLYTARHFDEARESLRRSIELRPEFGQPHATLALIELETGHLAKAMEEARAGFALDPHNPRTLAEAGYVFAVSGQTAEAQTLLATVQDLEEQGAALPVFPALIEVGLGQRDQARATLKQMFVTDPTSGLKGVVQWHAFDGLVELRSGQIILAKESKTL
jgi:TolB-like protein/Tfp pilus assembly protein PilF